MSTLMAVNTVTTPTPNTRATDTPLPHRRRRWRRWGGLRRLTTPRSLADLIPRIKRELDHGYEAGLEHYRRAGEMLLEARKKVERGWWGSWLKEHFDLSKKTAHRYMTLAKQSANGRVVHDTNTTLSDAIGERRSAASRRKGAHRSIQKVTKRLAAKRLAVKPQTPDKERKLHREMATKLVAAGYRTLKTHYRHGEAKRRLRRVRDRLNKIAKRLGSYKPGRASGLTTSAPVASGSPPNSATIVLNSDGIVPCRIKIRVRKRLRKRRPRARRRASMTPTLSLRGICESGSLHTGSVAR